LVYVANSGSPSYTGFRLTRGGQLLPIAHSTVTVPSGSALGDVLFNRTGTTLVGTEVTSSEIDSYNVGWNGRLRAAPGSPYIGQGLGQLGAEFNPANPSQLFVSNAHNGTGLVVLCYVADFACHDIRRRIPSLPRTHDALDRGSMDFDPDSGYLTKHY